MSDFKRCKSCGNPVDPEVAKSHDGACPWCLAAFTFGPEPTGTAAAPAATSNQFGKYVRTERLGSGGMGEVWKALDTELNRWVALKFLKDEDPSVVARFQREAKTAAALSHSNIAAIYEVGEIDGRHFIAMQHIQGRTMAKFAKKDRRLIVRLFRDAARAVDHAHRHGIIHRDLKPENLMVEEREEGWAVVVLDFGLARPIEGGEKLSQSGEVYGTAPYMSPEQARGEHLDERADVYALGATMYDVLTGKPPFEAGNLLEVIRKVGNDEPVRPRKLNPRIHRDLETVVLKCLEKDRERRYANARELADDLERFLNSDPIVARPPSTLYRLRMRLSKRKAVVATAAAGLVGMIIVAALILTGHEKVVDARAEAGTHVDLARLKIDQLDQMMRVDEDRTVQIERLASGAREELDLALRICPEHEEACFEMGRMFALTQRTGKALEFFTRAIKLAPRQAKAYLGRAALNLEIYENLRHFGREGRVVNESEKSRKVLGQLIEDLKKVRALSSEVPLLKYAEGMVLFAKGGYAEAAARFGEYVELAPADAEGWLWRGHAQGHAKACEEAIQSLTRALKLRPRLPGAYVLRGIAHYDLNRFDDAIADYTRAIELDPKDSVAHLNRGNAKHMKGLHDEAIADMSKAIDLNPKYAGAYINRGNAKGAKGLHDECLADLSKAIELDPTDDIAFCNRGNTYQHKGLQDAAIADYDKALELNPKDPKTWTSRGSAKNRKKLFDEAIADHEEALKLDPKYALAYNNRGWAKASKGQHLEAIKDFTRAVELDPKLEVAWGNRAGSRHALGRYDEALVDLEQCVMLDPGDFKNYVNRGVSKQAKGLVDEAIADFTKAIAMEPKDWLAWMNRGYSKSVSGRLDEGIADMTKAIELAPDEKDSYINRGVAYSKKGLEDLAIADHTKVIALDPKEPLGYYNRALALEKLGRFDEARTDFEKAIAVATPGWRFWSATQKLIANLESRRDFRVAYTLYHQGKLREAIEKYKVIVEKYPEAPDTKTAAYNVACGYALLGEKKDALDWLEKSVQMGWKNFDHMKRDRDLDSLRKEERYLKLMEESGEQ
jgi:tetratricopeptide (TPR) repeat protein